MVGRWLADLVMILVAAIWALNNVVMKAALAGWASPGAFNAVRFACGALVLAVAAWRLEGTLALPRRYWLPVALVGVVGNGMNQLLFINGLARSTAANAGLWLAIVPLLVAVFGAALGMERVTPRLWAGAAVTVVGIALVVGTQGGALHLAVGDALLAGAVTLWAGYTLAARRLVQDLSPLRVTAVAMVCGAAFLLALHLPALAAQDFRAVPVGSWLGMIYAAVLSNAVGYTLYVWCVRRLGAAKVTLYSNLTPILTAVLAMALLGEAWRPVQWLGAALVLGGIGVARWDDLARA